MARWLRIRDPLVCSLLRPACTFRPTWTEPQANRKISEAGYAEQGLIFIGSSLFLTRAL